MVQMRVVDVMMVIYFLNIVFVYVFLILFNILCILVYVAAKNCVKANCTHGCFNTPDGAFCPCSRGFGRTSINSCADIDECYLLHGQCSQRCHNNPGSYSCSCDEGYQLQKDNKSCKAEGADFFYYYCEVIWMLLYSFIYLQEWKPSWYSVQNITY